MKNTSKYLGNELKYLEMVLKSEKWSSTEGSWCNRLEQEFAKKFGANYAVAMNSGTATLHAALTAIGVKPGDEVITPALTVIMDTSAIIHANAIPVYADVEGKTWNIDPRDVRRKITSKTKAIIAVSLYGCPCDMKALKEISKDYDIPVIEDNAQYLGKHRADITSYSFENTKPLSCGEGGIVVTNNEAYARRMRNLGNHGFKNSAADEGRTKLNAEEFQRPWYKRHNNVGWNYRLSEFNAAIALAQLERSEDLGRNRIEVAKLYVKTLNKCIDSYGQNFFFFQQPHEKQNFEHQHNYWAFSVTISHRFKHLWSQLHEKYVELGGDGFYGCWSVPYLEPVMTSGRFRERCPQIYEKISYAKGLCPVAEAIQPLILQFKTNYRNLDLAKEKISMLEKAIKEVLK